MKNSLFLTVISKLAIFSLAFKFEDVTNDIFSLGDDLGIIAAFGHFNSDEFTDIISLQQGGYRLVLLKGSENRPYFQETQNCSFGSLITSVVPGDYNGDSIVDVLITLVGDEGESDVKILWGINGTLDCKSINLLSLRTQPFVVDFNGDMIPDIIGETKDEGRFVWISSADKIFTNRSLTGKDHEKMKQRCHSSGLIDLNNDLVPDILIMSEKHIEMWLSTGNGSYVMDESMSVKYPAKAAYVWQSTFVDMDLDGTIDLLLPVCYDDKCQVSAVLVWNSNASKWETLLEDFKNPTDGTNWGFKISFGESRIMSSLPATLRVGDVDMDGYPDLIINLQSKKVQTKFQAVILKNIPCETCFLKRALHVEWDVPGLKDIPNVRLAAFFDLYEDGTLDVLVSSYEKDRWKIHALQNTEVFDSCFLKVLVLNGLCGHGSCITEPYGVNQPGPMVRYNMTTQDGKLLVSTSVQLSQSAFFPLQLPFSHFGLGQTPNFIDILTVSIPAAYDKNVHMREWLQIIPNSQIVVIPHPPYQEKKWVKKLYVTPSHLVLLTCISLVGTCIFLSLIVALLQWKERREDKKEKMQDAYRFHFDAM
ncbi:hypothetical protein JTE90_008172 [Oedothorax gibbosus]|uniref:T-cell immunomodulatory protein TIP C2 domain-containing protein n=1 Tax=Oedothorax gibbosus TaxID=931172 RepID=A0AAV6VEI8_9ARAC|nr:hypothetical protein JTE90_008172 [Oedothorax gibbosus]